MFVSHNKAMKFVTAFGLHRTAKPLRGSSAAYRWRYPITTPLGVLWKNPLWGRKIQDNGYNLESSVTV